MVWEFTWGWKREGRISVKNWSKSNGLPGVAIGVQTLGTWSTIFKNPFWSGISPIHCAAAGAHPKCLELLIQAGFDVNFMLDQRIRKHYDDHRKSALYFAVSNGDLSSVKLLLSAGAMPNQDPVNCLQIALRMGNYELVSLLLRHGANVNYFCRVNPLHFPSALQYTLKDEVMLRMLLNYGYDTELCFDCPHGDKVHRFSASEGWTSTVIKDTMVSTHHSSCHPVSLLLVALNYSNR